MDEGSWQPCKRSGQKHPLYTAPWQPELYSKGLHVLQVRARDSSGSEMLSKIEFALDDTKPRFPLSARLTLMLDFTTMVSISLHCSGTLIIRELVFFYHLEQSPFRSFNHLVHLAILHHSPSAASNHS